MKLESSEDTRDKKEGSIHWFEKERLIYIIGEIDQDFVARFDANIQVTLEKSDKTLPLRIVIHSTGGDACTAFAMFDTLRYIDQHVAVETHVKGRAKSAALLLSQAGRRRYIYPHSIIQFHNAVLEYGKGDRVDEYEVSSRSKEFKILNRDFFKVLADRTGAPYKKIQDLCYRSVMMGAEEALVFNLFDEVKGLEEKMFLPKGIITKIGH